MLSSLQDSSRLGEYTRPLIALLVVGGFAAWFLAPNYNSARPSGQPVALGLTRSPHVDGLLTEDPLMLVARAAEVRRSESDDERVSRARAEAQELRFALKNEGGSTLVLCVWVPGSAWPEESERRIRARHAVVQALTEERYEVELTRKLALVTVSTPAGSGEGPWLVGYDHFERPVLSKGSAGAALQAQPSSVVVLWIDESRLADEPLVRVDGLLKEVLAFPPDTVSPIEVRHLGPSSSGVLERVAKCASASTRFRMWSPCATKPLPEDMKKKLCERLDFTSTIGDDKAIARLLVHELKERVPALSLRSELMPPSALGSVNPLVLGAKWLQALRTWTDKKIAVEPEVRVAVIAEQDSAYGRQWLDLLAEEAKRLTTKPTFESIGYIGVIDGGRSHSTQRHAPATSPSARGDERFAQSATPIDERYPQGTTQIDYLSRLETQLSTQHFDAVGVFGNDFYDTMLVLQVLRPRFPNILFFTIDLDARFSHGAHLPYTRNLIVASHLGLVGERSAADAGVLDPVRQRFRPSFRDIYEHSLYRAVRGAISGYAPSPPSPRVFEMSVHGPVELNQLTQDAPAISEATPSAMRAPGLVWRQLVRNLSLWRSVNAASKTESKDKLAAGNPELGGEKRPPTTDADQASLGRSGVEWSWLPAALALAGVWHVLVSIALRPTRARSGSLAAERSRYFFVLLAPPAVALVAALLLVAIEDAEQHVPMEPIGWLDGVSAWPSIFARIAASAFCIWACFNVRYVLLKVHAEIRLKHMLFLYAPKDDESCPSLDELLNSESRVRLDVLWESCGRWLKSPARFATRVGLGGLLVAGAFWAFDALENASPPVRGVFAYLIERVTWAISTWSFASLVFAQVFAASFARKLGVLAAQARRFQISAPTARASAPLGLERSNRLRIPTLIVVEVLEIVDRLTWMPALAVAMFVVVRAPILDAWAWSPALVAGLAYLYVVALLATWRTRSAARRTRSHALELVDKARRKLPMQSSALNRLELLAQQLEGLHTGAFAPVWQHPLVTSAVYPLIAYAATASPAGSWLQTALRVFAPA